MNLRSTLDTSLNALSVNKGRTALTSLGITIGIAAVIAMVSAGEGARSKIDANFRSIGPNLVVAFSGTRTRSGMLVGKADGAFTPEDADALRRSLSGLINGVSEVAQAPTIAATEFKDSHPTAFVGGYPDVFKIRGWDLKVGTFYNMQHYDRQDKVCVLGSTVAAKLFPNVANPVGRSLRASSNQFTVIGVLRAKGSAINGADQDDVIMVPMTTLLKKITGENKVQMILVGAVGTSVVNQVKDQMIRILRDRHHVREGMTDDFDVKTMREYAKLADLFTSTLTGLIFAIASISLVVGGIGVMNIMLVSVTERTREIGIRMAVGARTSDVMGQFLIESVILALIGGLIGITLGASAAAAIAFVADWKLVISPASVMIAVLTSAAVGIFFGYYPARKASMLDPIEALRYE